MYEELFKDLLKLKLKIADSAINILPPEYKRKTRAFRNGILKAVHEITKECLEDRHEDEEKNTVKPISID